MLIRQRKKIGEGKCDWNNKEACRIEKYMLKAKQCLGVGKKEHSNLMLKKVDI